MIEMDRLAQTLQDMTAEYLKVTLEGLVRPVENKALKAEAMTKLKSIQETYFKKKTEEYQGTKWSRGLNTFKVDKRLGAKNLYLLQHQLISFVNKYIYRQSETPIEYVIYHQDQNGVVRRITTNSLEDYKMTKSDTNIGIQKSAITTKISNMINQELSDSERMLNDHYQKFTSALKGKVSKAKPKYFPEAHELEFQIEHQGNIEELHDHSWPEENLPKYYGAAKLNLPWYIAQDYFNIQVKGAASSKDDKVYSRQRRQKVDASFSIANIQTIEYLFSFLYALLTAQTTEEQDRMIAKAIDRFKREEAAKMKKLAEDIKKDGGQVAIEILTK